MSKAQGMSINTIVITAIALLVLVVLATILISQSGLFAQKLQTCQAIGGHCKDRVLSMPQQGCEVTMDGFQQPTESSKCVEGSGRNAKVLVNMVCCIPGAAE